MKKRREEDEDSQGKSKTLRKAGSNVFEKSRSLIDTFAKYGVEFFTHLNVSVGTPLGRVAVSISELVSD